jgi:hypothetical protein
LAGTDQSFVTATESYPGAVTKDWSVPANYDGEVNLKAQIDPSSVNPPGGGQDRVTDDFQTLTLNVEGTVNVKPVSESGAATGDLIVVLLVFVVLIAGLGGAYVMYRRSQPSAEETDSFGNIGGGATEGVAECPYSRCGGAIDVCPGKPPPIFPKESVSSALGCERLYTT